jgi:N-acetyl-beta-hexosaminidase
VKELFAALVTAVLEAAKHNAAPKDFVNVLEESKVPAERVKLLARAYEERHEAVRAVLSQINFGFAQVVGVTWRLDQLVSSDALGAIKKPVYFVTLKTQQPDGSLRDVEFTCSLQGLQDLVAKLRDACKQVERILQPAKK